MRDFTHIDENNLINNGFNSKNIISSQFLWYLKKVMPKNFGGFKNLF